MGLPIATLNSVTFGTVVCVETPFDDSGIVIQGSSNVNASGLGVARIGDMVISNSGYVGIIVDGSNTVITNGLGTARVTSNFVSNCYIGQIITGNNTVLIG